MFRRALRHPIQIAVQVLSLGVGLAACLTAFVALDALAFGPTPGIRDRVHLMHVKWASTPERFTSRELDAGRPAFNAAFEQVAIEGGSVAPAESPAGPMTARLAFVSADYFSTLGTLPIAGRLLASRDVADAATSAVISQDVWQRAFSSGPIDGSQTLRIAGHDVTVVGVAPEGFAGLVPRDITSAVGTAVDAWLPLPLADAWRMVPAPTFPWLLVAGRLTTGGSASTAHAQIVTAAPAMARSGTSPRDPSIYVYPAGRSWSDDPVFASLTVLLFLFIPLCILGIGCANTVNLQLARAHERAPELSIRMALGASRLRLVRLLAGDTVAVAALSSMVAVVATRALIVASASTLALPLRIGASTLVLAGLLASAIVVSAGLLPAVIALRGVAAPGRQGLTDGPRHQRLRYALVGLQVAACTALLFVTMLGARSIASAITRPGPLADRTALFSLPLRDANGAGITGRDVARAVVDLLASEPGIEKTGFADFGVAPWSMAVFKGDERTAIRGAVGGRVSEGWFEASGSARLAGRFLAASDREDVAVVNRALAQQIGGDGQLVIGFGRASTRVSVVGVVDTPGFRSDLPIVFLPLVAGPGPPRTVTVIARAGSLALASQAIRRAMAAVAPAAPADRIDSVASAIDEAQAGFGHIVDAGAVASIAAILMAAVGIFAMMTYTVERRTKEIGIRLAIGASRSAIVRTVVVAGAWIVAIGVAAGVGIGVLIGAALRSTLFVVSPLDPGGIAPTVGVLLLVAVAATVAPTLAATRVDALAVIRDGN